MEDWDGLIVGIQCGDGRRSCERHEICGSGLRTNSLIVFRSFLDTDGNECMAAVSVENGAETCVVGFLERCVVITHRETYANKYAQVLEFFWESTSLIKVDKNKRDKGVCSIRLLDNIITHENEIKQCLRYRS